MSVYTTVVERGKPRLTRLPEPLPFPQKPKLKEKRTTIIIGIRCPDGIVIASDSQVTGPVTKQTDYQKLREMPVGSNGVAVAGGAGATAFITHALEFLERSLRRGAKNPRDIGDCAVRAYTEVWKRYIAQCLDEYGLRKVPLDPVEISRYRKLITESKEFDLLVGARLGTGSQFGLYLASEGIADPVEGYGAIGTGSDIALYILKRYWPSPSRFGDRLEHYQRLALYTIDEVKEVAEGCGGPTHVWTITEGGGVNRMSSEQMADYRKSNFYSVSIIRSFREGGP
jgi:20S proteasome alpha/beta subunit